MDRQPQATACDCGWNSSSSPDDEAGQGDEQTRRLYLYGVPPLVAFCFLSVAVNARVLLAVCWVRRPVSPTLSISLSLAAADAFASLLYGLQLVLHSLLPRAFGIKVTEHRSCLWITLEMMRLSGIIVGVMHLLALAGNHYLGIRQPLRYASIMTHKNTATCILLLWLSPTAFFIAYFASVPGEGFQSEYCTDYSFLLQQKFRVVFSLLFFAPLVVMLFIYSHIFTIVRRHQSQRMRFSQVDGGGGGASSTCQQRGRLASSVKAIHTTLLILGSFAIGWMPAVTVYVLCCEDCILRFHDVELFHLVVVNVVVNLLVICKTLLNPIIYAARMKDIQIAIHLMNVCLRLHCCPFLEQASEDGCSICEMSQHRLQYHGSTTICRSNTLMYHARMLNTNSNGSVIRSPDGHRIVRQACSMKNLGGKITDL